MNCYGSSKRLFQDSLLYFLFGTRAFYFAIELAFIRTALCFFPQNQWLEADAPLTWAIYRNIPFALLGILIIVLFFSSAKKNQDKEYRFMWLTIVLSFAFYIPVVLWADLVPAIGFLMMPKTCAYVWTVLIGFMSMRKCIG